MTLASATPPGYVPSAPPLLAVHGARVRLGGVEVLRSVDLVVRSGEVAGVLGPNGAGKSTLLRAITGGVTLDAGTVAIEGDAARSIGARDLARRVAVVQQLPAAPAEMTVGELVLLGRHPHLGLLARESRHDRAVAAAAMAEAGCAHLATRTLGTLSGGQRRRAFIARALAQEPRLLLLDEPTANLDVSAQGEVVRLVAGLARRGVGVLVVLHDLTIAAALCDHVTLLAEGRVVAAGPPAEALTADAVRAAYGGGVEVLYHPQSGVPIVLPAMQSPPGAEGHPR